MNWIALWRLAKPFLPFVVVAMFLGGVYLYIDRQGYQRAKADAEQRQLVDAIVAEKKRRATERNIVEAIGKIDGSVAEKIAAIRLIRQTINIDKDLRDDPRYSSASCSLSASVLSAVNRARLASANPSAANVIEYELPPAAVAQ